MLNQIACDLINTAHDLLLINSLVLPFCGSVFKNSSDGDVMANILLSVGIV